MDTQNACSADMRVLIRCNATGEVRDHVTSVCIDDATGGPSTYPWAEGNFSCDCNRHDSFERIVNAQYESEDDSPESECGDTRYSVRQIDAATGVVLHDEFNEGSPA